MELSLSFSDDQLQNGVSTRDTFPSLWLDTSQPATDGDY